jgi:Mrp family chromosome partitioning ATPase
LDYLVIDLPPGTSDVVQVTFQALPEAFAVVVVTPQDVAHLDNRRVLTALDAAGVRLLGGVENMSGLHCPMCGTPVELFSRVARDRSIWANGLPRLGAVPWATGLPAAAREPIVLNAPHCDHAVALRAVAEAIRAGIDRMQSGADH